MAIEVEEGTWGFGSTSDTTDVTLASNVSDLSTAFVVVESCGATSIDGSCTNKNPSGYFEVDFQSSAYLWDDSGTTKIRFTRERWNDQATKGTYRVFKCTDGEFDVQRGAGTISTSNYTGTATISSVVPANCIAWINGFFRAGSANWAPDVAIAYVTASTTVTFKRSRDSVVLSTYRWIVVEFDTNKVAGVTGSVLQNVSDAYSVGSPLSLSWSGEKDTSLLFLQSLPLEQDSNAWHIEDEVIGYINSDTVVDVWPMDNNASTTGTDISWGVVDFGAHLVRVRSEGNTSFGNSCDDDETLSGHSDVSNMISLSNTGYDSTVESYLLRYFVHTYCSSTTVLEVQRNPKGGSPDTYWQVIEFKTITEVEANIDVGDSVATDGTTDDWTSASGYIKSGGSSGDWNNDADVEGAPDGSCMQSGSGTGAVQTCYPVQFSGIPSGADVYGIKLVIRNASTGDLDVDLYCTSFGFSEERLCDTADSGTCSAVGDNTVGGPSDLWGWSGVTGSDINGTDFYVRVTTADIQFNYCDSIYTTIYYQASGTAYYLYEDAGIGISATKKKDITKVLSAGLGINGDTAKSIGKKLAAGLGINAAATLLRTAYINAAAGLGISATHLKSLTKKLTAGIGISGTESKSITKKLSAGIGVSATKIKNLTKKLAAGIGINAAASLARTAYINAAAGIGISATKVKNITKALAAAIGINATATAKKIKYILINAGIGISSTISKSITKVLAAGIGINAAASLARTAYLNLAAGVGISVQAAKNITKRIAASIGVSTTATALRTAYLNLAAGIGINAAASALKTVYLNLAAGIGISAAATALRTAYLNLSAGIGINSAATTLRTAYLNLAAGVGVSAAKVKNITKALAAGIGISAAADLTVAIFLYLSAGIGVSATYAKSLTKSLSVGIGVSAQEVKNITKVLSAGIGINASTILTKTKQLLLDIGIGISSTASKRLKKVLTAGLGINASVTTLRTAYLNLSAGVGVSATKVKNITKALSAGVGISATKVKNIIKTLAAGIGINAVGIATKIGGLTKYIYASAGLGINAAKTKSVTKVLAIGVGISSVGSALRTAYLTLSAGIGVSTAVSTARTAYLYLSAGLGVGVTKTKSLTKKFAVGLGISTAESKTVGKKLAAGVGVSAAKVKNITKRLSAGIGISVSKVKNIVKRLAAGIGISAIAWRPILGRLLGILSPSNIYATMSADVISTAMTADVLSADLTFDDNVVYGAEDIITDALTYSGAGWWDGSWGVVAPYGSVSLDAGEAQVGSNAIKGTTSNDAVVMQYIFDGPVDISAYTHMEIRIKPSSDCFWAWPLFYIGISESTDTWGEPENFYLIQGTGAIENNESWQILSLDLRHPDFSYTNIDLTNVKSMYLQVYNEDVDGVEVWVDGIRFKETYPNYSQASLSAGVDHPINTDKITEVIYANDGEWYDGIWTVGYYWGPIFSQEVKEEGSIKTTGESSINLYGPVTPARTSSKQSSLQWEFHFTKFINFGDYNRFSFDFLMSVQDLNYVEMYFEDWDYWWAYYEPVINDDGSWHSYDIDIIDDAVFIDDDFQWDQVFAIYIVVHYNNYDTEHDHYIDNFKFFNLPGREDLKATLSADTLSATIDTG